MQKLNKKNAISMMGFAIVFLIVLGIVMILSAPMMMNKDKNDNNSNSDDTRYENEDRDNPDRERSRDYEDQSRYDRENSGNSGYSSTEMMDELRNVENRMNSRLSNLEAERSSTQSVSDKFICSLEGNVDADGNVISVEGMNMDDIKRRKMVFVCEYRN